MSLTYEQSLNNEVDRLNRLGEDTRPFLNAKIEKAVGWHRKTYALSVLATECRRREDWIGVEQCLRRCIAIAPDVPTFWIKLARYLAIDKGDSCEALHCMEHAISSEKLLDGVYVHAFVERARIAIALSRKDLAEDSIARIIRVELKSQDRWQLDRSLISGLQELGVSENLVRSYSLLFGKRSEIDVLP